MGEGMALHGRGSRWRWRWLSRWAEKVRDGLLAVIRPAAGEICDVRGCGPVTAIQAFAGLWRALQGAARDRPLHDTDPRGRECLKLCVSDRIHAVFRPHETGPTRHSNQDPQDTGSLNTHGHCGHRPTQGPQDTRPPRQAQPNRPNNTGPTTQAQQHRPPETWSPETRSPKTPDTQAR